MGGLACWLCRIGKIGSGGADAAHRRPSFESSAVVVGGGGSGGSGSVMASAVVAARIVASVCVFCYFRQGIMQSHTIL